MIVPARSIRRAEGLSDAGGGAADAVSAGGEDGSLIARISAGDVRAFEALFHTYYVPLWRFARRLLGSQDAAKDVVQHVFATLWTRKDHLVVRHTMKAYLYGAVHNEAMRALRHDAVVARGTSRDNVALETYGTDAQTPSADARLEAAELRAIIRHAIARLPDRQRAAMTLRWEHDMSATDIAHVLDISHTAATRLLLRAQAHLQTQARLRRWVTE